MLCITCNICGDGYFFVSDQYDDDDKGDVTDDDIDVYGGRTVARIHLKLKTFLFKNEKGDDNPEGFI